MRLLITGGLGVTANEGLNDYLANYYDLIISHHRKPKEKIEYRFMKVDITNFQKVKEAVKKVDIVVHLTAKGAHGPLSDSKEDWRTYFSVNVMGTLNLLLASSKYKIKKFIYTSSLWVYGLPSEGTLPDYLPIDEEHPLKVKHPYGLSKILVEDLLKGYHRMYALPIIVFRLGGVARRNSHPDKESLLSLKDNPALGKGHYWEYIDVRDVAEAVKLAIESDIKGYEVFNLTSKDHLLYWIRDNRSLVDKYFPKVKKIYNKDDFLSQGNKSFINVNKIERRLGFKQRFPLRRYLNWINSGKGDEEYYSLRK